jgi:putative membrane protein
MHTTSFSRLVSSGLLAACLVALALPAAAATPTTSAAFGDRQILGVLQTVNLGEINDAQKAKAMARNAEVKAYAQEMIRDHHQGEMGVKTAIKAVGTTATSALSHRLATEDKATMARLAKMKGRAFDAAYVQAQVTMHQTVLNTIDTDLMPKASSPAVKDVLTKTRATVAEHLQKAQDLAKKVA